jgi:hypothetical protein
MLSYGSSRFNLSFKADIKSLSEVDESQNHAITDLCIMKYSTCWSDCIIRSDHLQKWARKQAAPKLVRIAKCSAYEQQTGATVLS